MLYDTSERERSVKGRKLSVVNGGFIECSKRVCENYNFGGLSFGYYWRLLEVGIHISKNMVTDQI